MTDLKFINGVDYLLANTPKDFSNAVVKLLKDKETRECMAYSVYETARLHYDTKRLVGFLERIYKHIEVSSIEKN